MGKILFLILIPSVLFASTLVDKYLKKDISLDRAARVYLTKNGTRIYSDRIYKALIESKVYDVQYASFSGKFSSLKEFKRHISKKLTWRIRRYSHYGYFKKNKRYVAILIKRYIELDKVGGKNIYFISGRLNPGVKRIIAYIQDPSGNVHRVLPSSAYSNSFTFKFSKKVARRSNIFELIVETEHEGRKVATIIRDSYRRMFSSVANYSRTKDAEKYLVRRINSERISRGLKALIPDMDLTELARTHSRKMAKQKRVFHSKIGKRIEGKRIIYSDASENVGTSRFITTIHDGFMNSPAHFRNILNEAADRVGIGVSYGKIAGKKHIFVSQIFLEENKVRKLSSISSRSFLKMINKERFKRGVAALRWDNRIRRESKNFLQKSFQINELPEFLSLSLMGLKRVAYNKLNTLSIFSVFKNPTFYDKEFTHFALVPHRDGRVNKSLVVLASYKKKSK